MIYFYCQGFVTGGKDGIVALWDENFSRCLKNYRVARTTLSPGPPSSILLEDAPPIRAITLGQGKILVGTKHGEIMEIDKSGPITVLIQGHLEGELWGLASHPTDELCATVSDDMTVRVWDLATHRMKNVRKMAKSARSVTYSPDGRALAIGFKDGSFQVVDSTTLDDIVGFHHRKEEISDIKFSPGQGKYLAVASHDNFVDIYNVLSSKRVGICKGSSSYITHVDWDSKGKLLQTNSGAKERLFFEAPRGTRQTIATNKAKEIDWFTWTGVLGEDCTGIWPPHSDITDVNAVDLTKDKKILATGDDFGFVKVFEYPVQGKNAKFKKYVGHSAHVTNVRWTNDDSRLISVGGADTSVMVWSHARGREREDTGGDSDDSDTDSEEEGGYDSDVQKEKNLTYEDKIYANPIRTTKGVKPHLREKQDDEEHRPAVSRGSKAPPKVRQLDRQRDSGKKRRNQQIQELSLEFIHGYRGFDTRNNLHYLPEGDIVYHAAGAGIVLSTANGIQSFYLDHTDDIICLAVNQHPKFKNIVATGQIGTEPCVHVWDAMSKETLSVIQGFHTKGVCAVNFSCNGKLLVTVGIDAAHSIAVWKWAEGSKLASSHGHTERIFVAEFRPDSDSQFVTCGVKHVKFWSLAGGQLVGKRGVITAALQGEGDDSQLRMQTMLSVAFGAVRKYVHDRDKNAILAIMEIDKSGPITVLIQGHLEGELWGLASHPTDELCATVSDDMTVRVWDLATHRMKNVRKMAKSARSVTYSPDGRALAIGFKDGSFQVVDSTTLDDIVGFHHRKEEISDIKFSPGQGKYLAVASHDNFVDIYNVLSSKRVGICKGSSSYITHVDWDSKGKLLQTNSGAKERLFFEAPRGTRQTIATNKAKEIDWFTWTGVLGEDCTGIWPPHSDITDVNAVDLTKDKKILATGDDFGFVKVFEYPVQGKNAKFKKYVGHSAHVTNVRWTNDDSRLISVGGADTSVMVWSHARGREREDTGGDSDDSDTDSEEEGGYDSDVQKEKNLTYEDKIYANPIRTTKGVKPHLREKQDDEEHRPAVSRGSKAPPKVRQLDRQRDSGKKRRNQQIQELSLEFIHGYRGFDTRNNLHYLPEGDIVYHAAGAGIVLSTANGIQSFYLDHTDDIICLAVNQHPKFKVRQF
ncbi:echinoderm microtubule-associated protein-like 6, partial [Orbicella faveolata]|uniref:echinoderm microtubule-associated protein-like 6 n=1 Tax=Orbicella faveolata TaxID=48498 RepID=UPI0009E1F9A3